MAIKDYLQLQPNASVAGSIVDPHDLGWRKYFLVFVSIGLLGLGAFGAHFWKDWLETYKIFGGYLIDVLGIYVVGNVVHKVGAGVVNGKYGIAAQAPAKDGKCPTCGAKLEEQESG